MQKYKFAIALGMLFGALAIAAVAEARSVASYNLIVPRINGNAYTSTLSKTGTTRAVDSNTSNGGGYTMYTAVFHPNTTRVTSWYDLASGSRVLISYYSGQNLKGSGYRLGHSNKFTTLVNVQSKGSWSPDEK
jgi:hypothetical protein